MDRLLLICGNDIPFPEAQLTIHQPTLREIGYITEQRFWSGCELLRFDKNFLSEEDKKSLLDRTNFNIIMTMIQEKNIESQEARVNVLSLLSLLFPTRKIFIGRRSIQLRDYHSEKEYDVGEINEENFEIFKKILIDMFCLTNEENKQYNPSGDLAKKIAEKIKKGRAEKARLSTNTNISILSRYISILAVGQQKDINVLKNYTVYQLMDEYNRFILKTSYDAWERYRIAGATGMEDPQDWLKDIHEK